ncbi:Fic family protein [Clostridium estertheticum]|uniref:Fic family protein n=1 Tax=Clostridium estertheticum TaxID=238834 RepID=UPI001CF36949|nr:Fic/DOC family N-terminal domain-containing protein [Clostridium estertheticum]MCB2305668.1 Fic family protein [Clostridium estertheticum]MCB2344517.1 Fic family protein [Clostridium estertheticum]MCB2348023.1 Fic family protein [Clostridium estertheticum]WAG45666.1 Fic family protein [Clostridium estertheticum]
MKKPYLPFKLPNDKLIDKERLFNKVIQANKEIAIYNEKLKSSKVRPDLLMDLFSLKEALESSKIEGTQATIDEMLEYRSDEKNVTDDIKEVTNYYIALQEGVYGLKILPLSSRLIKNLHKTLLGGGVRGGSKTPGEFRSVQNYIGTQGSKIENASYIPPEPQLVDSFMSNLDEFMNENDDINDLIKIALIHAQFETIHPFLDGNGRIGRILIPLYLYNKGFISSANLFVSESLEKDKYKYYDLLNATRFNVTDKEDDEDQYEKDIVAVRKIYSDWIDFFLSACINESNKLIDKIEKINELYNVAMDKSTKIINSNKMRQVIDVIFEFPIFTKNKIKSRMTIPVTTLDGYLKKLVEAKVIYSDEKPRNRKYYFYDLINILR